METALTIAIRKEYPRRENVKFDIDVENGRFDVEILKVIVAELEDDSNQISLDDLEAQK